MHEKIDSPDSVPNKSRLQHSDKIAHNKKLQSFKVSHTTDKHRTISKLLARPNYFYPTFAHSTTQPSKKNQTETRSDHSVHFDKSKLKNTFKIREANRHPTLTNAKTARMREKLTALYQFQTNQALHHGNQTRPRSNKSKSSKLSTQAQQHTQISQSQNRKLNLNKNFDTPNQTHTIHKQNSQNVDGR
ncbi:hypothetical protein V8G54_022143 [Vigna mungo]|uniref:Uncharacterized protein n=1 Tax=Vigna mungo TaxID=3915 RepID=A0AAQ3NHD9_VIGMU